LPVAFALAWLLARGRFAGRVLLDGLVHLPLVLPPVVIGWMLLIAFGPTGIVGGWLERVAGVTCCSAGPGRRWPLRSWRCR
jgi:molybdate transport system permease protein